jgi:23S rRNA pseudouridine2605 synthase
MRRKSARPSSSTGGGRMAGQAKARRRIQSADRGGNGRRHSADRAGRDRSSSAADRAEPERLQKVLARSGLASRREAEDWIRAGRITINGEIATLGVRVTSADQVRLDGRLIRQAAGGTARAFICHRSPGENLRQPNADEAGGGGAAPGTSLLERLPRRAGRRFITISPMPQVDGGLELVTSDGELAAKLQRSVRRLVSEFSVRVRGELGAQQLEGILGGALDSGERLEVERCEPAGGEAANRWYAFAARGASGKDVRQLFERQGALVSRILRTHLGPITLERSLGRGHFRELAPDELHALMSAALESG